MLNALPTRDEIQRSIERFWRGGGTASLIVDVIRNQEGSLDEARTVAEELAARAASGSRFISREVVEERLEMVRASALYTKNGSKAGAKPSQKYLGLAWHPSKGWVHLAGYPPKAWLEAGGFEAAGGERLYGDAAAARPAGLHSSPASPPEET